MHRDDPIYRDGVRRLSPPSSSHPLLGVQKPESPAEAPDWQLPTPEVNREERCIVGLLGWGEFGEKKEWEVWLSSAWPGRMDASREFASRISFLSWFWVDSCEGSRKAAEELAGTLVHSWKVEMVLLLGEIVMEIERKIIIHWKRTLLGNFLLLTEIKTQNSVTHSGYTYVYIRITAK